MQTVSMAADNVVGTASLAAIDTRFGYCSIEWKWEKNDELYIFEKRTTAQHFRTAGSVSETGWKPCGCAGRMEIFFEKRSENNIVCLRPEGNKDGRMRAMQAMTDWRRSVKLRYSWSNPLSE